MKNIKRNTASNDYSFRGTTFHIPLPELHAAIRESLELHDRLVDDLVAEAQRHAALLEATRGRSLGPAASRRKPNGRVIVPTTMRK